MFNKKSKTMEPIEGRYGNSEGCNPKKKLKKKIYKRKSFWFAIIILILLIAISSSPESNNSSSDQSEKVTATASEQQIGTSKNNEEKAESEKDFTEYIDLVKGGYLGDYNDVTLGEVLDSNHNTGKWNSGESSSGDVFVDFSYVSSMDDIKITTAYQFQIMDNGTFKLVAMEMDGEAPTSLEELAFYMETEYVDYYGRTYPDEAAIDHMSDAPSEDILNGIVKN